MRGNGATDQAHQAEVEAMKPTLSPAALDAWMSGQMKSLVPRLQQYQNLGMKPAIIDPKTGKPTDQPVEQSMVVDPATGKVTVSRDDITVHSPQASPAGITGESPQRLGERASKDMKRGASREAVMHTFMSLGYSDDVIRQALKFAQGGK
jgi:hypothetical protein